MKKIINKTKQNNLKESLIPVTEGGIYALNIDLEAAADAFEDKLRDIFQVDSISMEYDRSGIDLELIPARGWVNNDPYFRATIHGLEEVIYKLMDDKYKKLVDENEVKINPYSDFEITGWKPTDYQNGVTLDAYTHTFDNEEEYAALDTESDRIGKEIAKIIFSHYDELVSLLSEFVEYDEYEDDELDDYEESLIPIEEASHPKLGKKVKSLKGWKIYQGTDTYGNEIFRCFTPDEVRPAVGYEDWETDTLEQAISWIENYDLEESLIPIEVKS